jgi:hypothetical protein
LPYPIDHRQSLIARQRKAGLLVQIDSRRLAVQNALTHAMTGALWEDASGVTDPASWMPDVAQGRWRHALARCWDVRPDVRLEVAQTAREARQRCMQRRSPPPARISWP